MGSLVGTVSYSWAICLFEMAVFEIVDPAITSLMSDTCIIVPKKKKKFDIRYLFYIVPPHLMSKLKRI